MEELHKLNLSHDEALVLFEFIARFCDDNQPLELRHNAEYLALMGISCQLDRMLVEPFESSYREKLEAARERLARGYEGVAPGVKPL
jgi:hypothetical protein